MDEPSEFCECGGKILKVKMFGRWFTVCDRCSPTVEVRMRDFETNKRKMEGKSDALRA